ASRVNGGQCVVLNERRVVMGMVPAGASADDRTAAEDVMRFGVSTVRPSEDLGPLLERMEHRNVQSVIVTRPDGVVVGLLGGDYAARAVQQAREEANPA